MKAQIRKRIEESVEALKMLDVTLYREKGISNEMYEGIERQLKNMQTYLIVLRKDVFNTLNEIEADEQ